MHPDVDGPLVDALQLVGAGSSGRHSLIGLVSATSALGATLPITEQLRLAEITANIDALTGGFFTQEIKKRIEKR